MPKKQKMYYYKNYISELFSHNSIKKALKKYIDLIRNRIHQKWRRIPAWIKRGMRAIPIALVGFYLVAALKIDWQQRLHDSIITDDVGGAKLSLFFMANINNALEYDGSYNPPIARAMMCQNPKMIRFLASRNAKVNFRCVRSNGTKFWSNVYAIDSDDPHTIEAFISAGGQLDSASAVGHNALTYAIEYNKPNATEYLLTKVEVNKPDNSQTLPLTYTALKNDSCEVADWWQQLEDGGAIPYNADEERNTILNQYLEKVGTASTALIVYGSLAYVISKSTRIIDIPNKKGISPLMKMAKRGDGKALNLLTKNGANMMQKNRFGKNAFDVLDKHGHTKLFQKQAKQLKRTNPKAFKKLQRKYPYRISSSGKILKKPLPKRKYVSKGKSYRHRGRKRGGGKILRFLGLPGRILSWIL